VKLQDGTRAWLVLLRVEESNTTAFIDQASMAVRPPHARILPPRTESFAVHFYGAGASLGQDTYTVDHATLGTFDLFLVPSGPSSYTAVFNRLVSGRRA
jgi:hypothetical protein